MIHSAQMQFKRSLSMWCAQKASELLFYIGNYIIRKPFPIQTDVIAWDSALAYQIMSDNVI